MDLIGEEVTFIIPLFFINLFSNLLREWNNFNLFVVHPLSIHFRTSQFYASLQLPIFQTFSHLLVNLFITPIFAKELDQF